MRRICLFYSIVFILTAAGCGRSVLRTDIVVGNVVYDGVPLAGANIKFFPVTEGSGHAAYATTNEDGSYKLQTHLGAPDAGTTPGEYIVTVSKSEMVLTGKKRKDADGTVFAEKKPKTIVPEIYTKIDTTPFRVTVVKRKKNVFDFELKKDGT